MSTYLGGVETPFSWLGSLTEQAIEGLVDFFHDDLAGFLVNEGLLLGVFSLLLVHLSNSVRLLRYELTVSFLGAIMFQSLNYKALIQMIIISYIHSYLYVTSL